MRMYRRIEDGMTEKKIIAIRADGNATLGMGHIMRCMSIAKAIEQASGGACVFFTAQEQTAQFIREKGFVCEALHTDYRKMESEIPYLQKLAEKYNPKLWLVDSYQITAEYIQELRRMCPVFYLDDIGEMIYEADGLINYNIYGEELGYRERCPQHMTLLLGAAYAPVKKEFANTPYELREEATNILITMGGSDALNISGQLAVRLSEELPETVNLTLICGRFNPHLQALQVLQNNNSRIQILVDVPDMWNYLAKADVVVSAAGSTMYELGCMGIPTVCCYYVENQRRIAEGFSQKAGICNAGDFSENPQVVLNKLTEAVNDLIRDREKRKTVASAMKRVADGKGALRIADILVESAK